MSEKCKTCGSPQPHLHPSTQFEGEVSLCLDEFHLAETSQNRPSYISAVRSGRAANAALRDQAAQP